MKTLDRFNFEIRTRNMNKFNPTGSFHKFMELPISVRRKIYKAVLDLEGQFGRVLSAHGTIGELTSNRRPFLLPAVCLTSKSECKIATTKFLHNVKFVVCCEWCGEQTLSFLDRLPGDFAHAAVRTLVYDHYVHDHYKNDGSFSRRVLDRLPQIQNLVIIMSVWDVIERPGNALSDPYRPLTALEIIQKKDFRPIIMSTALKYVHFSVIKAGNLHQDDVMEGFYTIGSQMHEAFDKQGQDVRLRFTHYHRDDPKNDSSYSHRAAAAESASA
ncbi:hypothetical protein CC86DRAFT_385033 [Ophiobolus disseminans]|uniref:Uncharacterized protein n=1 Tax=Ophiobolus disseminans TaxID=1469910 RepID=A0A6A6ZR96_9PLEO|nr:hypothetical protein CC86DRAFT_385033 [Ophiobolus disseminans]